jgi:hypothetical protein
MIRSGYIDPNVLMILAFLSLLLTGSDAMATPEARFTVIEKENDFELRRYEPQIVAQNIVEGDFTDVGNSGFRRLFEYINGKNRKKVPIPMTAPVLEEIASEKIPMTAPVNQERENGKWVISFVMPSDYTLETLPEPLDPGVSLKIVPGRLVAVLKYSGTWSRNRYDEKQDLLEKMLRAKGLTPTGEPIFARYNPPWTLWFLRRNEVLIPVERAAR